MVSHNIKTMILVIKFDNNKFDDNRIMDAMYSIKNEIKEYDCVKEIKELDNIINEG